MENVINLHNFRESTTFYFAKEHDLSVSNLMTQKASLMFFDHYFILIKALNSLYESLN
jgi:hypothetical protein